MITDRDISMCAFFQGAPLTQLKVKDAMCSAVGACNPEDELETAEALMQQRQVRRLPVLDTHGKLLGILSLADLVRRAQPRNTAVPGAITGNQIRDTLAAICKRPAGRQAARSPSAAAI
jgi:CBS-domain-containing membrane protein